MYQAIYDATRSRIGNCDAHEAISAAAREAFDMGYPRMLLQEQIGVVANEMTAPHVLMRPKIFPDGNAWCALYGDDLQAGVAGFGDTAAAACADFDKNWFHQKLLTGAQK